jgi:predicted XRE-type DNA-binding protein
MTMAAKKVAKRKWYWGSSLDDWLKEEGWYEEFNATLEKERIAKQIDAAMKKQKLSKKRMAELMKTSRTQVDKLLNPEDGNVTIETLHRAPAVVGKRFEYKLV